VRAPGFWYAPPGPAASLLAPLAAVWTMAGRVRRARARPFAAPVPVICVGNLVAGGAGKTPIVLDILTRLRSRGIAAHALARGHGGRLAGPVRVDPAAHTARDVGDEPLLLSATGPTWIARDRAAGARAASADGASLLVLDDGFQNPHLVKDLSLLVVDGATGFGNGRVMPAGPLREPLFDGMGRARAVVLMGPDRAGVTDAIGKRLPILHARLEPDRAAAARLAGVRVLAFAGIGRPAKFFETLETVGAHLAGSVAFPDHHPYTAAELHAVLRRAESAGARPITTAKDAMRLPPEFRARVGVLPVHVTWRDPNEMDRLLNPLLTMGMIHDRHP